MNIIDLKWLKTLNYSLSVGFVGDVGATPMSLLNLLSYGNKMYNEYGNESDIKTKNVDSIQMVKL